MFTILRQKQSNRHLKKISEGVIPNTVEWHPDSNTPAEITFSDGLTSFGSCIHCFHPPCMEFSESELQLRLFQNFPADRNSSVCPTDAISLPDGHEGPIIAPEKCIACGLCINRCPVRAIYFKDNTAQINDVPNIHFVETSDIVTLEATMEISNLFENVDERGVYQEESDAKIQNVRDRINSLLPTLSAQFPNHLARNLLLGVSVRSAMRRRGDTNIRMDLVLEPLGIERGTAEVEFGSALIDAPRNILDNIAVLVARYEIAKEQLVPLIISLELPNQRSEYWRFINDVRTVLDVHINSITVGALIILLWNRSMLAINTGKEMYIDETSNSLRPALEEVLGHPLKIIQGYPGLLESAK